MIHLTLPYPPSANRLWRRQGRHMVLSQEARDYKAEVAALAVMSVCEPLDGDIEITLHVYRPRKSGDLSNRIKVLEDSLQGYAYVNDSQIVVIHAYRHDDKINPRVEVTITPA